MLGPAKSHLQSILAHQAPGTATCPGTLTRKLRIYRMHACELHSLFSHGERPLFVEETVHHHRNRQIKSDDRKYLRAMERACAHNAFVWPSPNSCKLAASTPRYIMPHSHRQPIPTHCLPARKWSARHGPSRQETSPVAEAKARTGQTRARWPVFATPLPRPPTTTRSGKSTGRLATRAPSDKGPRQSGWFRGYWRKSAPGNKN